MQSSVLPSTSASTPLGLSCTSSAAVSKSPSERPTSRKNKKKHTKDLLDEEELENCRLENKKIKLEIEKLIIEKQKLEAEKELIDVKKAYMLRQFEERFPNSVIYSSSTTNTSACANTCNEL